MTDLKVAAAVNSVAKKRGIKGDRASRGLPSLDANQRMIVKIIQQAENACKLLKMQADRAEPVQKEVLTACSTLSTALSGMLGV